MFRTSSLLAVWLTCAPAYASNPRAHLEHAWQIHLLNPPLTAGTAVTVRSEHGPMDIEAVWSDGVAAPYWLDDEGTFEFIEFVGEDSMRVKSDLGAVLLISRQHLDQITREREAAFREKLRSFETPDLTFVLGERVRYRRAGVMRIGTVAGVGPRLRVVEAGRTHEVDRREVFRQIRPTAETIKFRSRWIELGAPHGRGRDFLNALARWSSQPVFLERAPEEQMRLLAEAVLVFIPWHYCAAEIDAKRPVDLNALLYHGYGVCRHLAIVTALVLREAGFPAILAHSPRHMWVQVDGVIVDASTRSLSAGVRVGRLGELSRSREPTVQRFVRDHYTNLQRMTMTYSCGEFFDR